MPTGFFSVSFIFQCWWYVDVPYILLYSWVLWVMFYVCPNLYATCCLDYLTKFISSFRSSSVYILKHSTSSLVWSLLISFVHSGGSVNWPCVWTTNTLMVLVALGYNKYHKSQDTHKFVVLLSLDIVTYVATLCWVK